MLVHNLEMSKFPKLTMEQFVTMIVLYVRIRKKPYRLHDYRYMLEREGLEDRDFLNFVIHVSEMYAEKSYLTVPTTDEDYCERSRPSHDDVGYGAFSSDGGRGGSF